MNKLIFAILTDAPYTEDEIESAKESFIEMVTDVIGDDDADVNSAQVSIVDADSDDVEVSDDVKAKIIADFVANSTLEYNVQARFRDEDNAIVGKPFVISGTLDNGNYEQGE